VVEDQNRVVPVGNKGSLSRFFSTDGNISVRMVYLIVLLRGRGKYTEIRYT
jgi:hypothetical protein